MSVLRPSVDRPHPFDFFLRNVGFSLLFALAELVIFAPLLVLAQVYAFDSMLVITCLQLIFCFIAGSFLGQLKWLNRKGYEILLCAGIGYGLSFLIQSELLHTVLSSVIGALLMFRGIRYTKDGWLSLYPPGAFVISGVMYFIGVPIMVRTDLMHMYAITLNACGFCSLILYFFITNRAQLLIATLAGNDRAAASSLSQTVKRSSRIWLIVFIAVVAAVGYFQQVKNGLIHLLRSIAAWLLGLMSSDAPPEVPEASPSAPPMQFPPAEPHEPGWFSILLNYIQLIVGYILIIALVLGVIYLLVRKLAPALLKLVRRFMNRSLRRDQSDVTEGYIDEKEALLDWRELPTMWWQKASSRLRRSSASEPTWARLPNNQERIRFLYRLLIEQAGKRGYTFKKSLTPNETGWELTHHQTELSEASVHALTSAYNRVRYGRESVSDEQLAQVLQTLDSSIRSLLK
jgi:hypothetical protein